MDHNLQCCLVSRPGTVVIGSFHAEDIRTCRQVGISGAVLIAYVVPVLVEAFKHIGILVLLRRAVAQRSKRECHHLPVTIAKRQLLRLRQVEWQPFRRMLLLIHDAQTGDIDRWHHVIDFNLIG